MGRKSKGPLLWLWQTGRWWLCDWLAVVATAVSDTLASTVSVTNWSVMALWQTGSAGVATAVSVTDWQVLCLWQTGRYCVCDTLASAGSVAAQGFPCESGDSTACSTLGTGHHWSTLYIIDQQAVLHFSTLYTLQCRPASYIATLLHCIGLQ